jgi:hypothetical protein
MNSDITSYGIPYLICVAAFGWTLVGLLLTAIERRLRSRQTRDIERRETRRLAA